MVQTTNTSDNSGMGVVLGILIAVLLVVGGFFFLRSQGMVGDGTATANIEAPDVTINNTTEPAAGEPTGVPAQVPASE